MRGQSSRRQTTTTTTGGPSACGPKPSTSSLISPPALLFRVADPTSAPPSAATMNDNDATLNDATMNGDANVDDGDRRPTRARGKSHLALLAEENRKAAEENDEFSGSEEEEESEDEDEVEENSDSNNNRQRPIVHRRWHWTGKALSTSEDKKQFQSVDGEKIFRTASWDGGRSRLDYRIAGTLTRAEKSLVAKQDDEHSVTLEPKLNREKKMTQIPYRKFAYYFVINICCIIISNIFAHHICVCNHPPSPHRRRYVASLRVFCGRHSAAF